MTPKRRLCAAALPLLLLAACAAPVRTLSPVTEQPTQLRLTGKFVWVDLLTHDIAAARSFYGELFGWTFDGDPDNLRVLQDGRPIAGMLAIATPPQDGRRESAWIGNLSVADVDRAAALVEARGGVIARGPLDVADRGRLALVKDPGGAPLVLLHASGGDPPDREPEVDHFLWRELWTHDVPQAVAFYEELVGYEVETLTIGDDTYTVLLQGDVARAGVVQAPPDVKATWLPFVRVVDPARTAARARALGARVVLEEADAVILVDPTGAPIGLQVWEEGR